MCDTSDKTTAIPTVQIDTPRMRVTEWHFPHKGAQTGWHRHAYDYVVVPLFNGQLRIELPGGEEMIAELRHGVPYARDIGTEHNVISDNDFECAFIELELLEDRPG
ncbi:cupin domain-containing protein [Aliiroseovarius crassostreae]|uniref:cupin domain-containing protein n=1 Tax=Aliiroseovarius crassostreae TaxID=154981 RepID=UPI00220C7386|nr:cupin domain-containing protein [Aliiroseovarius crassostreae]UWP98032.1 cupin domain-containing protein [Aliiroseovarius crassostreae]